jgi:ribosome biogenesis protein BMS1
LTGLVNNEYRKHEVHNLARFISVMKFKDIGYRTNHPFVIADRLEDLTKPDLIRQNEKCDRNVCLYGYVRGCPLKSNINIHIPGCGDYIIHDVSYLADPCPLPTAEKKRTLDDKERLLYAPFSGVGGLIYDKDAVYIDLAGSHSHSNGDSNNQMVPTRGSNQMFNNIIETKKTIDSKLDQSKMQLFSTSEGITNQEWTQNEQDNVRVRRKAPAFDEQDDDEDDDEEGDEEDDEDDDEEDDKEEEDSNEEEEEEEEEEEQYSDEEDDVGGELNWKSNLRLKASENFQKNKRINWKSLIYGKEEQHQLISKDEILNGVSSKIDNKKNGVHLDDNEDDEDFFKISKKETKNDEKANDNTKFETNLKEWNSLKRQREEDDDDDIESKVGNPFESIKDCFVTGKWEKEKDAASRLRADADDSNSEANSDDIAEAFGDNSDEDDDEMLYGDFEDYETGQVIIINKKHFKN